MITMTVEISDISTAEKNEFGTGVMVFTKIEKPGVSDSEGATFVGICTSINEYMRSRGVPDFNCLKQVKLNG